MPRLSLLPRTSRIVALCSAANFINAADRVIMPIAIVPMAKEFNWNFHWQGWILSAFAIGYFASQVNYSKTFQRFKISRGFLVFKLLPLMFRLLEQIQQLVLVVKKL